MCDLLSKSGMKKTVDVKQIFKKRYYKHFTPLQNESLDETDNPYIKTINQ